MTDNVQELDAREFAQAITGMRFSDVMKVVEAINQANGTRKTIDGTTLLAAASLIIENMVGADNPPKPTSRQKTATAK